MKDREPLDKQSEKYSLITHVSSFSAELEIKLNKEPGFIEIISSPETCVYLEDYAPSHPVVMSNIM